MFPLTMFVYGTLMNGYSNHHFLASSKYLGRARTVSKYSLYTSHYPFVNSTIADTHIVGELYEIPSQDVLSAIDELEDHPVDYERMDIEVQLLADTSEHIVVRAHIYFNNNLSTGDSAEKVFSGSFHDSITADRHRAEASV